jgi:methionine sulfoxide reductase heme-binding subunit
VTGPSPLWFLDRSAGEVTLLLLTAILILGIARAAMPSTFPVLLEGMHVNLALLAIVFGGLHVLAAILDPFARLGPVDAFVPFTSAYRGTWLGLGVISAYVYLVTIATSWPHRRLPRSSWVWLHRAMYGGWVLAVMHSLGTGSDARNELFLVLDVAAVAVALVAFVGLRVAQGLAGRPQLWTAFAIAGVLTVVLLGVWAMNGPLKPGWARSSGTPANLLKPP